MCNPQFVSWSIAKQDIKTSRVIRLSPQCILTISLLIITSFLAGRLSRLMLAREIDDGVFGNCSGQIIFDFNTSDTSTSRTMASGQYLTIEVSTQHKLDEYVLHIAMETLVSIAKGLSDVPLNYSVHCNISICLAISHGGHIAMHSLFGQTVIIDVNLRDYNHTSQHQQQRIHSILNATFALFKETTIQWSHKLRGFRDSLHYARHKNPLDHEMGVDVLRRIDEKKLLISTKTQFQNVDIYELPRRLFNGDAAFSQSLRNDGVLGIDRALYLDGVLQSSFYGDAAYHEALVHPAMITHKNPHKVAIIGGGEGATLREVLKHSTVEDVVMLEIDEELTMLSRKHLSEWSDCSDLNSSGSMSCFDDERVHLHFADAFQWFIDSYSENDMDTIINTTARRSDFFDVIIMDALDPDDFVDFADKLYNNTPFIQSVYNGLSSEGVFVVQLGAAPDVADPSDENGAFRNRAQMITNLQELGFESIHIYEEGHCDFYHPWSMLVAFKDYETRSNWYRNAAEIQLELHQRIARTKSGSPSLLHFDAATMIGYQLPSKSFECIFCRQDEEPEDCDEYIGFWPQINNVPISEIKVQKSGVSEHAGRGIFVVNDVPAESMIDLGQGTKAFHVAPSTWDVFDTLFDWVEETSERSGIEGEMSGLKYFIEGENNV